MARNGGKWGVLASDGGACPPLCPFRDDRGVNRGTSEARDYLERNGGKEGKIDLNRELKERNVPKAEFDVIEKAFSDLAIGLHRLGIRTSS